MGAKGFVVDLSSKFAPTPGFRKDLDLEGAVDMVVTLVIADDEDCLLIARCPYAPSKV